MFLCVVYGVDVCCLLMFAVGGGVSCRCFWLSVLLVLLFAVVRCLLLVAAVVGCECCCCLLLVVPVDRLLYGVV